MQTSKEHEELWLSQTRINAYLSCPYYYKLTYIDKVPVESKGNYHTALGNGIHKALEEFYKIQDYELDTLMTWWNVACHQGYVEKNGQVVLPILHDPQYEFHNEDKEREILDNHGKKLLRQYYHANKHDFGRNEVVATELHFKVPVGQAGHVILNGYIDRIDRTPEGQLVIIDYKTGKERTQEDVEWDTQLTLYALAVRKTLGEIEGYLYLHFIKSGNKVNVTRTKVHFDDLLSKIKDVKQGIYEGMWEPKLGSQCRYCLHECPIGGNVAHRARVKTESSI